MESEGKNQRWSLNYSFSKGYDERYDEGEQRMENENDINERFQLALNCSKKGEEEGAVDEGLKEEDGVICQDVEDDPLLYSQLRTDQHN